MTSFDNVSPSTEEPNGTDSKVYRNEFVDPVYRPRLLNLMDAASQQIHGHSVEVQRKVKPEVYEEAFQVWFLAKRMAYNFNDAYEACAPIWTPSELTEVFRKFIKSEHGRCSDIYCILADSSSGVELNESLLWHQDASAPVLVEALLCILFEKAMERYEDTYGGRARLGYFFKAKFESVELSGGSSKPRWLTISTVAIGAQRHLRAAGSAKKTLELPAYLNRGATTSSSYYLTTLPFRSEAQTEHLRNFTGPKGKEEGSKRPRAPSDQSAGDTHVGGNDPKRRNAQIGVTSKNPAKYYSTISTHSLKPNLQSHPAQYHSARNLMQQPRSNRRKKPKFR